jgi:hypothetical protein
MNSINCEVEGCPFTKQSDIVYDHEERLFDKYDISYLCSYHYSMLNFIDECAFKNIPVTVHIIKITTYGWFEYDKMSYMFYMDGYDKDKPPYKNRPDEIKRCVVNGSEFSFLNRSQRRKAINEIIKFIKYVDKLGIVKDISVTSV